MSLHLKSPQRPCGATEGLIVYYLVTTWLLLVYYLVTTWLLLVYYLFTTWLLLGLLLGWGLMVGFVRVETFRQ